MSDTAAMGRTIREARLARGMSLSQLASAVGRSSSSVRRWERGEVPPAIGIIDDLADVLELDPEELRALRPGASGHPDRLPGLDEASSPVDDDVDLVDLDVVPIVSAPDGPVDTPLSTRPPGFIDDVREVIRRATASWSGWIRGALTAGVLLVMALILIWALAGLFDAFGQIWDSFDAGG